jgi:hypothetical protein
MRRILFVTLALAALTAPVAAAQHEEEGDTTKRPHGRTFSVGSRENWTFSTPHIDFAGGVWMQPQTDPVSSEGFFRLHMLTGAGPKLVEVEVDLVWLPAIGATPTLSAVLQLAPFSQESRVYFSAGGGFITGRADTDRLSGLLQAQLAFRTPIHELTPFITVARPFVDDAQVELQFGIAHPLAPYLLHFP